MVDNIIFAVWALGWVITAAFFTFYQGYANKRFNKRESDHNAPYFIFGIVGFAWPILWPGIAAVKGFKALYELGDDAGKVAREFVDQAVKEKKSDEDFKKQLQHAIISGDMASFNALLDAKVPGVRFELTAGTPKADPVDLDKHWEPTEEVDVFAKEQ